MLAANPTTVRDGFKDYCDQIVDSGEVLIVTRKNERNVVMISLEEYNQLVKAKNNADYLYKLNVSIEQLQAGNIVTKTMEELEAMANE